MVDDNKQAAKNAAKAAADLKKQKKKKWCPIVAPAMFQNRIIGESLLDDASMLMNRHITANMMQLTGDMKRQNINIMFKVNDVKEGKGLTIPVKFEISSSSLRRFAKREKDKLTDSFVVKTSDNILVRIKPLMITNNATKGSIQSALIRNCRAICKELVNNSSFEQLITDLVMYRFQKQVKEMIHKTYPLRTFEVRVLQIENKKKKESVEEEEILKLKKQNDLKEQEKLDESEIEEKPAEKSEEFSEQSDSEESESEGSSEQSEESSDNAVDDSEPSDPEESEG